MSFFGISILNLKKTIHFIHFGVRPPNLAAGVYDHYAAVRHRRRGHVATIMQWRSRVGILL
jgi:hypothetical protein